MINYIAYNAEGRITIAGNFHPDVLATVTEQLESDGLTIITESAGGLSPINHWYDEAAGEGKEKTPLSLSINKPVIIADNSDVATVSGLPIPCTVHHDNTQYLVTDGSFEFTADQPGAYLFQIDEPMYLREEFTIDAT